MSTVVIMITFKNLASCSQSSFDHKMEGSIYHVNSVNVYLGPKPRKWISCIHA